ncbi:serine protease inhibitor ecotin [Chitinophaga sp. HK235]|uniref:serine protease inhibitor ecotin n=1 Tax=Chitinophaga sp. HK235 TaxID=2952571 RepID=UPI001BAB34C8|nr:serine protease inhibitor ecotin [Chitinophaga sp. HK235]
MKQFITLLLLWSAGISSVYSQDKDNLKPFPPAWKDVERYVIQLSAKDKEDNFQVEIMAGKTMKVDCNQHGLIGRWVTKDVKGWGYTYYQYVSAGNIRSTLMACPDKKLTDKFIFDTRQVRYNSKLPIVVYVPKGFAVKYKIWERGEEEKDAVIK